MIKQQAHVYDRENGTFSIETPYHEAFIQEFKELVIPQERDWDKEHKQWHVDSDCYLEVLHLMSHYFEPIVVHDAQGKSRYRLSSAGIDKV